MSVQTLNSRIGDEPFAADGSDLSVAMDWIMAEERSTDGPEEMLAVLEGALRLICDGETYDLKAGQGALIAAGSARRLSPSGSALVYRVRHK